MKHIYIMAFAAVTLFATSDVKATGFGCHMDDEACAARIRGVTNPGKNPQTLELKRPRDGETGDLIRPKRTNREEGYGRTGFPEEKPRRNLEEGSGSSGIFNKDKEKKGAHKEDRHGPWR